MSNLKKCLQYVTFKQFPDGSSEITSKVNAIYNTQVDRKRKYEPTIRGAKIARTRAHKQLFDILRSNNWSYFVTLTFGVKDRNDDDSVMLLFQKWRKYVRRHLPDMIYVCVPEYHKKGCLHLHLVVGGVSAAELGLVDSHRVLYKGKAWMLADLNKKGFIFDETIGDGSTVYNVTSWKGIGWSTATEIRSQSAVSHYVGKYISKSHIDPRFYNQKRYFTSRNVMKPDVVKFSTEDCRAESVADDYYLDMIFQDCDNKYTVFRPKV